MSWHPEPALRSCCARELCYQIDPRTQTRVTITVGGKCSRQSAILALGIKGWRSWLVYGLLCATFTAQFLGVNHQFYRW